MRQTLCSFLELLYLYHFPCLWKTSIPCWRKGSKNVHFHHVLSIAPHFIFPTALGMLLFYNWRPSVSTISSQDHTSDLGQSQDSVQVHLPLWHQAGQSKSISEIPALYWISVSGINWIPASRTLEVSLDLVQPQNISWLRCTNHSCRIKLCHPGHRSWAQRDTGASMVVMVIRVHSLFYGPGSSVCPNQDPSSAPFLGEIHPLN